MLNASREAEGLLMPLPAMSGAVPPAGSNIASATPPASSNA
jgi:hypothetical protein